MVQYGTVITHDLGGGKCVPSPSPSIWQEAGGK